MLRDLDAVDQFRWTVVESKRPDAAVVATRMREALWRFGADPNAASMDEAAARVSGSAVKERITSALDRLLWQQKTAEARALLRRVDADPFRDAVRDSYNTADPAKKIAELSERKAALQQPPGFVAFLGGITATTVERRRQLLESALHRRSGNLGLLMTLGATYPINQESGANERLRWYQAAVAAAPSNLAALNNLGVALKDAGRWDEAIACYKKAIEARSYAHSPNSTSTWALRWKQKGSVGRGHCLLQEAVIELDPKYAMYSPPQPGQCVD